MTSNILQINYNLIEYIQNLGQLQNYNILTTIFIILILKQSPQIN